MDTLKLLGTVLLGLSLLGYIVVYYILPEVFPWQSLWAQRNGRPTVRTKSYKGRTALITGANGAFGSRAAKLFADHGISKLILVDVRDCTDLKKEIGAEQATGKGNYDLDIRVLQVDMLTFAGCNNFVKKVVEEVGDGGLDHVLFTMGVLEFSRRESPEGWERSIQINYLSNALPALLLLPHLKSSPSNRSPPVLTFVTSFGLYPASPTMGMPKTGSYLKHLSNNKDGLAQAHQYGRSKALLLYFAKELANRITAASNQKSDPKGITKVTITSADPGSSWTPLTAPNKTQLIPKLIMNLSARDPKIGATALVNGASASEDKHGHILTDFESASYPPFMLRKSGQAAQQRVWEETRKEFEAKVPEVKAIYDLLDVRP